MAIADNTTKINQLLEAINNLPSAGAGDPVVEQLVVTPSTQKQVFNAFDVDGYKPVTVNAMPTATQATPSISDVDSNGIITASVTQSAGYVFEGTKSTTKKLPIVPGITITPGTNEKTAVPAGCYTTGDVKIAAMPTTTQAELVISDVDSNGKITASATQTAGYVSGGTKSTTKQLTVQPESLFLPGTSEQRILSGRYLKGDQIILGDQNLIPENIKEGVSIFTVLGTFAGSDSSSGGDLPNGIRIASDVFEPTEDISTNQNIPHSLGVQPDFFIWILEEDVSEPVAGLNFGGAIFRKTSRYNATSSTYYTQHYFYRGYSTTPQVNGMASSVAAAGYMNPETCRMLCNTTYKLKAGYKYRWIAGAIEDIQ